MGGRAFWAAENTLGVNVEPEAFWEEATFCFREKASIVKFSHPWYLWEIGFHTPTQCQIL